eukprot:symbB.v1.2.034176.t1/scaffold4364.1/size40671/5
MLDPASALPTKTSGTMPGVALPGAVPAFYPWIYPLDPSMVGGGVLPGAWGVVNMPGAGRDKCIDFMGRHANGLKWFSVLVALWLQRPAFLLRGSSLRKALTACHGTSEALNTIAEKWHDKAQQWQSGRIPDLIPPGLQYNPDLRSYYEGEGLYNFDDRPFQSFTDEERKSRPELPQLG